MSAERIERLRESMMRLHDEWVAEHGIGPTSDFIVKRIHAALRADEEAARQETPNPSAREAAECPFCPDGHRAPGSRPMAVWIGPERDGDGQPTTLHVSEAEAQHLRDLLSGGDQ